MWQYNKTENMYSTNQNSAIIAAIGAAQIGSTYIRNRINSGKYYI